jgi:hypothetical protein
LSQKTKSARPVRTLRLTPVERRRLMTAIGRQLAVAWVRVDVATLTPRGVHLTRDDARQSKASTERIIRADLRVQALRTSRQGAAS